MGRAYRADRVIRASGVHTFYAGKPDESALVKFIEAYSILNEQTFSETMRDFIGFTGVKLGLLKDPGVDTGVFLDPEKWELTPAFEEYRQRAETARVQQLKAAKEDRERKEQLRLERKKKLEEASATDTESNKMDPIAFD